MPELIMIRSKHERNFKTIDLDYTKDANLSWGAKGLLTYILGRPDDWILRPFDLQRKSKEKRDAIKTYTKELCAAGYICPLVHREKGKLYWTYVVFEQALPTDLNQAQAMVETIMRERGLQLPPWSKYFGNPRFVRKTAIDGLAMSG